MLQLIKESQGKQTKDLKNVRPISSRSRTKSNTEKPSTAANKTNTMDSQQYYSSGIQKSGTI
jgi:hypothetical protein